MQTALPEQYYRNVRHDAIRHLPPTPLRILEVGCGSGSTLAHIRRSRRGDWLGGVELVALESELYAELDYFERMDVEQATPAVAPGSIDVLMCLDVLEHLRDPGVTLSRLATLLRPDGLLIVSLPNIQFASVSIPLLFGKFEYAEDGILDRTHLRFFTRRSALAFLRNAAFELTASERLHMRGKRWLLSALLPFEKWKDLWASQLLFVARYKGATAAP